MPLLRVVRLNGHCLTIVAINHIYNSYFTTVHLNVMHKINTTFQVCTRGIVQRLQIALWQPAIMFCVCSDLIAYTQALRVYDSKSFPHFLYV